MEERIDRTLKIAYVGNGLLNVGFKIAGLNESYVATDTQQSEARIKDLTSREEIGIIIITSSIRKMVKDRRLSELISSSILPLIVEIPEPNEQVAEEDTLRALIMRAIGIDITKNI